MSERTKGLPELLAPAGDMECLRAAVAAGADAVYFGASAFNARARAKNFDKEDLRKAIAYLHKHGRKAYVTLNTAVKERELADALSLAADIYMSGADAVIAADMGLIREIRRQIPELEVHISTQAGVKSTEGARAFAEMGAKRAVLARELSAKEIKSISDNCGIETEVFVHGALCVCVSGRCLFSSLVGGRSGNRGECAQPCRLPYNNGKYLLSLKDMSLAESIPELIATGTASLKIEGRLKAPEYVYGVTKIYRRLLDERRNATPEEVDLLRQIFSRGGFTDGYFKGRISSEMNGIRGDNPERAPEIPRECPKIPLSLAVVFKEGHPVEVKFENSEGRIFRSVGPAPERAESRPMSREDILKPLTALGTTDYEARTVSIDMDEGLMVPLSRLKAMRREAIEALEDDSMREMPGVSVSYRANEAPKKRWIRTAKFYSADSVTDAARDFFDVIFLPAESFDGRIANGAFLPEVSYEKDSGRLSSLLLKLHESGCEHIMVSDIGELHEAARYGFKEIHTDIGFNVYNSQSIEELSAMGAGRVILSPELTLPAARSLSGGTTVYGRIPLMVMKKCISRETVGCDACKRTNGAFTLHDRKGISFKGMRESGYGGSEHGSIIFNSFPTYMGDKLRGDAGICNTHFIFSFEKPREVDGVIEAYKRGEALPFPVRRI